MSHFIRSMLEPKCSWLIIFSIIFVSFAGCGGCDIEDVAQQINNGNDDEEILIVETWSNEIRNALSSPDESPSFGLGVECLDTDDASFTGRLTITVSTALLTPDGQIELNPTPYWSQSTIGEFSPITMDLMMAI